MKEEGRYPTTITAAEIIELRFPKDGQNNEDSFELKFTCQAEDGSTCNAYLEVSGRYGTGTKSNKTQAEITVETLQTIGWKGGYDFSGIQALVGNPCNINVVKKSSNGKEYLNYYIAGAFAEQRLAPDEIARRVARLSSGAGRQPAQFGQTAQQYQQQFVQPQIAAQPGPFPQPRLFAQPPQQLAPQQFGNQEPFMQQPQQPQPPFGQQQPAGWFGGAPASPFAQPPR